MINGLYICFFYDVSWFDYLWLLYSLLFSVLDDVVEYYWLGCIVEEIGFIFMNEFWFELFVIEVFYQGVLELDWVYV